LRTARPLHKKLFQLLFGVRSIGRYGLIGVTGVALDLLFYFLLVQMSVPPTIANFFSTLVGITNNFIWNSLINFKTGLSSIRGLKFLTVGLLGLTLSTVLLNFFLLAGLKPFAAKCLSVPLVVSAQYIMNQIWTFRR
jgi:dolichol-phosphate mannosyltransferase